MDDNARTCEDLSLADMDNDRRRDIVAASRATRDVKVYLNQGVE